MMISDISIIPATLEHCDAVRGLIDELENCRFDPQRFNMVYQYHLADKDMYCLVACQGENVVGFISLSLQQHLHHAALVAEIQELMIAAACRGQGVGQQLLNAAQHIAVSHGAVTIELSTNQRRTDAHRFYLREGFQCSHYRFVKPLN